MMNPIQRDKRIILRFLSGYELTSWAAEKCKVDWPDCAERRVKAVDAVVTRRDDGYKLAIEHTLIEPFVDEREDFSHFEKAGFLDLQDDPSLQEKTHNGGNRHGVDFARLL